MGCELRYKCFLRKFSCFEGGNGPSHIRCHSNYHHVGLTGWRAAVPRLTAKPVAAFQNLHMARVALERVFLVRSGWTVHGGGTHRVRSRVLHSGKPFRCLGAAGIELRGIGEYRVSLDIRRGDWIACFYERRIYFSPICDSFFRPAHAFPLDCSDRAGVFVELSAQQLPSRTAVHSRHRDRLVRHSRRDCYAALGYSCDPHLALHRGCVSGGLVPASFE